MAQGSVGASTFTSRGKAVNVGVRMLLMCSLQLCGDTSQVPISQNRTRNVVLFEEVWKGSYCRTMETLVDILSVYPHQAEHIFKPSCVLLRRCGGCCGDETLECVPLETRTVVMQVVRVSPVEESIGPEEMKFTEHSGCECRPRRKRLKNGNKSSRRQRPKGKALEASVPPSPQHARSRAPRQRGSECKGNGHRCKKPRKKGKKKEGQLHRTGGGDQTPSPRTLQSEAVTGP